VSRNLRTGERRASQRPGVPVNDGRDRNADQKAVGGKLARTDTGKAKPRETRAARLIAQLPSPVRSLTLAEIEQQHKRVFDELERGGAIRVYAKDDEHFLGVLTRDKTLLDAADIAMLIENGHIPPLDELIAMDDRPYRDWQPRAVDGHPE